MRGRSSLPWFSSVGRPLGGSGRRLPPDYRYHILPCLAPTNINHQGGKWVAALPKVRGAALSRGANVLTPTALPLSACMHSHSHTHQPLLGFSSLLFSHTLARGSTPRAVSPAFVYPSDAPLSHGVPTDACTPCVRPLLSSQGHHHDTWRESGFIG